MDERELSRVSVKRTEKKERLQQQYTILMIFRVLFVTDVLMAVVYMTEADPTVIALHMATHSTNERPYTLCYVD